MQIFPFFQKQYTSRLEPNDIKEIFINKVSKIDWQLSVSKLAKEDSYEGKIINNSFVIGSKKYSLTYGMGSFYPITKGKLVYDKSTKTTTIKIVTRLSILAILTLTFFYLIAIAGFIIAIKKNIPRVYVVCIIFFITTYFPIVIAFNIWKKKHLAFIKSNLLGTDTSSPQKGSKRAFSKGSSPGL